MSRMAHGHPEAGHEYWSLVGKDSGTVRQPVGAEWRRRGFTTQQGRRWLEAGFTTEQARRWLKAGFDVNRAARLRASGCTPESAQAWNNPRLAPVWVIRLRQAGVLASDVSRLRAHGFSVDEILDWSNAGFSVDDAPIWRTVGSPRVARAYRQAGYSFHDARIWSPLGPPEAVGPWRIQRFSPEEAAAWGRYRVPASDAAEWRAMGFTPEYAAAWARGGISPTEAKRWSDCRFTARLAQVWRDACGDLERAVEFQRKGILLTAASVYSQGGMDAATAARWRSTGIPPEDAVRLWSGKLSPDAAREIYAAETKRRRAEELRRRLNERERVEAEARQRQDAATQAAVQAAAAKRERRLLARTRRDADEAGRAARRQDVLDRIQGAAGETSSASAPSPDRLLGMPTTPDELAHWCRTVPIRAINAARSIDAGIGDLAYERWDGTGPARILPPDVRAVRAVLASTSGADGPWPRTVTALLYDALTYLVSPAEVDLYFESEPLDRHLAGDVRLPWPEVTVLFGADFAFRQRHLRQLACPGSDVPYGPMLARGLTDSFAVFGVILLADQESRVCDEMVWLLRIGHCDGVHRVAVPGRRSQAAIGRLLSNLDAAVCWAGWDPTDDSPPEARRAARALPRVAARRRTSARTIKVQVQKRARYVGFSGLGPATTPHKRRGHWRRQRVGPRDDWHYEVRWIHPTIVAGHLPPDNPDRIYRLPD